MGFSLSQQTSGARLNLSRRNRNAYSADHTNDLADKYNIAMGEDAPSSEVMVNAIETGNTDRFAQLLAMRQANDVQNARNNLVNQIAQQHEITNVDLEVVRGLSQEQMASPNLNTILEETYAQKLTDLNAQVQNENTGALDDALSENPDLALDALDRTKMIATRQMIAQNMLNTAQQVYDNLPLYPSKAGALLQTMIPFRSWAAEDTFTNAPRLDGMQFPGDRMEDQISWLYSLPPDQMATELKRGVDREFALGNYLDALNFLHAVVQYSQQDMFIENVFAGLDIATSIPIGELVRGLKASVKAVRVPIRDVERIAVAAGSGETAAAKVAVDAISEGTVPSAAIKAPKDVEVVLPSNMRPAEAMGEIPHAPGPVVNRLEQASLLREEVAKELLDVNQVERLSIPQVQKGWQETEDILWSRFNHPNHSIINVTRNLAEDTPTNTYSVTMTFGRKDGSTFPSKLSAQNAASKWLKPKTGDYKVVQMDSGWAVEITKPIDESTGGIRSLQIDTDNKSPDTFLTRLMGISKAFGPNIKLSTSQRSARSVIVQSQEKFSHLLAQLSKPIASLNKKEFDELHTFFVRQHDNVIDQNRTVAENIATFEDQFYAIHNKAPTEQQIDAWQTAKQIEGLDFMIREADVLKQKYVLGIEEFTINSATNVVGEIVHTAPTVFEGKALTSLPRNKDFSLAIIDPNGTVRNKYSRYLKEDDWTDIDRLISEGYVPIQAFKGRLPLGDRAYNFILVKDFKRASPKPNLTAQSGQRYIQKHSDYVKQPRIDGNRYYGDRAIINARSNAEAHELADIMNRVMKLSRTDPKAARKLFEDSFPMFKWRDILKRIARKELDPNVPFVAARTTERTNEVTNLSTLMGRQIDEVDSEYDLSKQVLTHFVRTQEPLDTFGVEKGTVMRYDNDSVLSPFDSLRSVMSDMIDTRLMNDYRLKSIRDFTSEFGHLLDGQPWEFDTFGMRYIFEPNYKKGANPTQVRVAEGVRKSILSLFNHKTHVDRAVDLFKEKVARSVRGLTMGKWIEDKALPFISHTDDYMRWAAFHSKMGLFNHKQFLLQLSTMVNVVSISPYHGLKGARSAQSLIWANSAWRPEWMKGMGKRLASLYGFKPDEWEEMATLWNRSGYSKVGGDVSYVDNLSAPNLRSSKVIKGAKKVLDWGTIPFNAGERFTRAAAFATAYSERKAAKGAISMNRADEAWILKRAKTLTGNMTRESNAGWQRGWSSVATQFFGFQARQMELMLGKELSKREKAQLFLGMSLMYGVPVAGGMAFGILPLREMLRDYLINNNIQYDNTIMEPVIDGFASQLLETLNGSDYNVSERYGPGGLTTFYDLYKGNIDFVELLYGASGGILLDTIADADPLIKGLQATIDFNDDTYFPITESDIVEVFRNISTVNNAIKLEEALQLGRWISQNETWLTNINANEALTSFFFSLDPERVSDAFDRIEGNNTFYENQSRAKKQMVIDYKRAIAALRGGNEREAEQLFSRVKIRGVMAGMTTNQLRDVFIEASHEEPLDESVMRTFERIVLRRNRQ